jgi:hypothetical protein
VGTAVRTGDGFRLSLGELSIGAVADTTPARARAAAGPSSGDGPVFPPYGRSRGAPIAGASVQDLEFYIGGSRRSLDDPSKARWHEKERVLLAAMEAELRRNTGEPSEDPVGRDDFDDGPPPTDDDIPF